MNPDYRDMLSALCDANVEFLVVGAYSMAAHGFPRATGDIDIWIRRSEENAARAWDALKRFRAPLARLKRSDLQQPDNVFQIGTAPRRIDLLTSIDGVEFDEAWPDRKEVSFEGLSFFVIGRAHLIQNKKASARPKDMADVAWLESEP